MNFKVIDSYMEYDVWHFTIEYTVPEFKYNMFINLHPLKIKYICC